MADEIANAVGPKLQPLTDMLMHDATLQIALVVLVAGFMSIFLISRKISVLMDTKRFSYARPYATEFIKKIMLSLFAIVLIVSVSAYIQVFELFDTQIAIDAAKADEALTPRETFAKILNTFVILMMGYTVAHLIPIILSNNEARKMEKHDYQEWIHLRGFSNDQNNLFHQFFKWAPPKHGPSDMLEEEYQEKLKTVEGRKYLENYYTTKGIPIGSFKQIKPKAF